MASIMHCIVVGIENDRIASMLRIWRWRKEIERNRKQVIAELNTSLFEIYRNVYRNLNVDSGVFPKLQDYSYSYSDMKKWLSVGSYSFVLHSELKKKARIMKKARCGALPLDIQIQNCAIMAAHHRYNVTKRRALCQIDKLLRVHSHNLRLIASCYMSKVHRHNWLAEELVPMWIENIAANELKFRRILNIDKPP